MSVIHGIVKQGEPATMTGRIQNVQGQYITQASLSTITYAIFDLRSATPMTPVSTGSVDIPSTVFDILQINTTLFPVDNIGYNFSHQLPQTAFPNFTPQQYYRVEYRFTDISGLKFTTEWQPGVDQILSAPL